MLLDRIERWYDQSGKKLMRYIYIVLILILVYIFFKYIFQFLLPFAIAWILASLLNPFVTLLKKYLKVPRGIGTLLSMLTVLTAFFGAVTLVIKLLWQQIVGFSQAFPNYAVEIKLVLEDLQVQCQGIMDLLPLPTALQSLDDVIQSILNNISGFLTDIVGSTASVVIRVPDGLFFVIVVLISTFFMTKDRMMIKEFVKAQLSEKFINQCIVIQKGLKSALESYVKTQLILMCITFTICSIGLLVLQRPYVLLVALGISALDALPMFGSGAILIPWAIFHLVSGNVVLAVGLFAIYGIIVVMRQIMEPKVLSTQIGVYALVTLMSIYIGFKTIGVLGLIIGPILVVMVKTLQAVGLLPNFKAVQPTYAKQTKINNKEK